MIVGLLISHVLGDFYLQNNDFVEQKNNEKITFKNFFKSSLFLHFLIVLIFILPIFLFFEVSILEGFAGVGVIAFSHLIIDYIKIALINKFPNCEKRWFLLDQILHVMIIVLVSNNLF